MKGPEGMPKRSGEGKEEEAAFSEECEAVNRSA